MSNDINIILAQPGFNTKFLQQIFCRELFPHIFNNFQRKFNTEVKGILHACSSGNYNDLSGRFARLKKILNEENKITSSELERNAADHRTKHSDEDSGLLKQSSK